jgi:hypothetical protein
MPAILNRRRFERFSVRPMYTAVHVRRLNGPGEWDGHVYDISEAGLRFEVDRPLEPGTPVSMRIALPGVGPERERTVFALATVIWADDAEDEPGPVRMAAAFTRLGSHEDRERLLTVLGSGRYARAA